MNTFPSRTSIVRGIWIKNSKNLAQIQRGFQCLSEKQYRISGCFQRLDFMLFPKSITSYYSFSHKTNNKEHFDKRGSTKWANMISYLRIVTVYCKKCAHISNAFVKVSFMCQKKFQSIFAYGIKFQSTDMPKWCRPFISIKLEAGSTFRVKMFRCHFVVIKFIPFFLLCFFASSTTYSIPK